MRKFLDLAQTVLEWLLVIIFILGSITTFLAEPLKAPGVIVIIFGGQIALYIYALWFGLLGLTLLYAKVRKRKKLHRNVLMAMYLTAIYTFSLSFSFYGLNSELLDDVVVGLMAAWCWLRWKMRTEYLDPAAFQKSIAKLEEDTPPF